MKVDSLGCVSARAAAKALGVHPNTIRNWCNSGKIVCQRLPGSGYRRIPQSEVERLLNDRRHRD